MTSRLHDTPDKKFTSVFPKNIALLRHCLATIATCLMFWMENPTQLSYFQFQSAHSCAAI